MVTNPALEVREIAHWFGREQVLDDISFSVPEGEILCLLGPSGCGKSTLLRIIAGLISPRRGKIFIRNEDQRLIPTPRRNIGFMFQTPLAIFPHMSVFENVAFPFKHGGHDRRIRDWRSEVGTILDIVDLQAFSHRPVTYLSGGQLQRLGLARAVVHRPDILLLDEPVSSLDHHLRREMLTLIKRVQETYGCSAVCVTHNIEDAIALANDIVVMGNAIIRQKGSLESVLRKPSCRSVAEILGRWNILPSDTFEGPVRHTGLTTFIGFPTHAVTVMPEQNNSTPANTQINTKAAIRDLRPHPMGWQYECEVIDSKLHGKHSVVAYGAAHLPIGTDVTITIPIAAVIPIQPF